MFLNGGEHGAEADLDDPQPRDLVDLDLGIEFAPALEDGAHLVRRDGVDAASEGDELYEVAPRVACAILCRAVQPCMVCPLVEDVDLDEVALLEHGVFGEHGEPEGAEELVDAVVDLGIAVIGPPREHDDVFPPPFGLRQHPPPLGDDRGVILLHALHARPKSLFDEEAWDMVPPERADERLHRGPLAVGVEVGHDEIFVVEALVVGLQEFGIIGDDGAVVVVDAVVLVEVVALAGVEDEIHAHVEEGLDVPVHELGGIAGRVARDGVLAAEVELARTPLREHHVEAARLEEGRPKRELFIHDELERQPHLPPRSPARTRQGEQFLVFEGIEVEGIRVRFEACAALALVARDVSSAVGEGEDVDAAMPRAPLARHRLAVVGEAVEFRGGEHGGDEHVAPRVLLGIQGRAECPHEPCDGGPHDLLPDLEFEGAENGVV